MEPRRSLKRGSGLLMSISVIGAIIFLSIVLWINWPKPRITPEPLSPTVSAVIDRIPGSSDALIFIGLKDIRESGFWKEVIPDSLKQTELFEPPAPIDRLMKATSVSLGKNVDSLLVSFRRKGYRGQDFLAVAWGPFSANLSDQKLRSLGTMPETIAGQRCHTIDSTLWLCRLDSRRTVLTSSRKLMEGFLKPNGSFFKRDSLAAAMIDKARWKSQLWFALPSAAWTGSALASLMSANSEIKELGNLNRIQHLALSARFSDGIEAQTEWIYKTKSAAWFASTFLWSASAIGRVSGGKGGTKLLEHISIQQNLESVLIEADLPADLFSSSSVPGH